MSDKLFFTVPPEYNNVNAQSFLRSFCGLSSRMITRLKREKDGILMDGKILRTIDTVTGGKLVEISLPSEIMSITPVEGYLDVLYEDDYILIVNKPPSMPVHPVKQHQDDTLANIVAFYAKRRGREFTFRAINRLDKDTSGIVFIAKDRYTANAVKFALNKTYYAVCSGKVSKDGTVNRPIALRKDSKMVREVTPDGAPAVTHYRVIAANEACSLLELTLETGRTHQIRCHMAYLGHPLEGDDLYGGGLERIKRQALHCGRLDFIHPITKETITVTAPIPNDMKNISQEIKNAINDNIVCKQTAEKHK